MKKKKRDKKIDVKLDSGGLGSDAGRKMFRVSSVQISNGVALREECLLVG